MLKKIVYRGLLGFSLGVFVGYSITIVISLFLGNGTYSSFVPSLIEVTTTEINAVILQFFLSGFLGMVFAIGSVVWEIESWSILKQTVIHFCISVVVLLPVAYLGHWMEHSVWGITSYFLIFIGLYCMIWGIQYSVWKRKIQEINQKLEK